MPESHSLQAGQKVGGGRFTLVKPLGRGGMGEVWLAGDERLREEVALKFLPPEIRGDPTALDDLRRETARSHKLSHPNIVRLHDLHEDPDGTAFIVMEYIDGQTFAALRLAQTQRVLRWDFLQPLVRQLCAALEYAHGENVIHRDLKPANIMVDARGRLKLADFGIAAVVSDSMSRVSLRHSTSGTLPYMSPQQLTGKRPCVRDDIYALGATLYEMLTGKPPFYTGDLTHQVLHEPPEPMEERLAALGTQNEIPGNVAALVMACLAKETGQRPASAGAVAGWIGLEMVAKPSTESLAAALFPQAPSSPTPVMSPEPAGKGGSTPAGLGRRLAAVGMVVLAVAGAGWLWKGRHRSDHDHAPATAEVAAQTAPASEVQPMSGQLPVRDGLVLYFSFDKPPSGGIVRDESGTGNDGQVVGAKWTAQGRSGGGLEFSPTDCYVRVSNSDSLNPSRLTLAAWIKTTRADAAWRRIFDKNFASGFALSVAGDWKNWKPATRFRGHVAFELNHRAILSDLALSDGQWHHLAAIFDGATQFMFVDGVEQQNTRPQSGRVARNEFNLRLGGYEAPDPSDNPRNSFDGVLDEVMIFNRALSPDEVRQVYESTGRPDATTTAAPAPRDQTGVAAAPPLRYGLYLHFGIETFAKAGEGQASTPKSWKPIPAERFSPTDLDVRQWVRLARNAGVTFAVLTAKHESGFCLWAGPNNDYDLGHSPFKRDLIAEFVAACKAGGLVPGLHYSISDANIEGSFLTKTPVSPSHFAVIEKRVAELETRYAEVRVLILDGSRRLSSVQLEQLRREVEWLNPRCAVWDCEGVEGLNSIAATVISSWMWAPNSRLNSAQALFHVYQKAQAEGKAFVLNVGPDTTGRIPAEQTAVLMDLKKLIANGAEASASASTLARVSGLNP